MSPDEEITKLLRSAHADLIAAHILNNNEEGPSLIICFHAQQAVEKSVKAVLISSGTLVRKIHDLIELLDMIKDLSLILPVDSDTIALLNPYAVKARYDDTIPDTLTQDKALEIADLMVGWSETAIRDFRLSDHQEPI